MISIEALMHVLKKLEWSISSAKRVTSLEWLTGVSAWPTSAGLIRHPRGHEINEALSGEDNPRSGVRKI